MEGSNPCKNCGTVVQQKFCQHCGQKVIHYRWTLKKLSKSFVNAIFNLEKGFFYTFKSLTISPGKVINNYLDGNTVKYTNPFRYALIAIAISTFFILYLGIWKLQIDQTIENYKMLGVIKSEAEEVKLEDSMKFVTKFMNIIPFLIIPFMSLSSILFLQKRALHYAEHLILNTFMIGQSTLYGIVSLFIIYLFPEYVAWLYLIGLLIAALVYSHIFQGMFNKGYIKGLIQGFFIYITGFAFFLLTIGVVTFIVGILISIVLR
ncbi:DUF3667 domain-containing protein [Aquimarina sp. 2201CG5-10]|uniref:DUF3667 domain-containing protein n=1 Tax=Aquimarina callyspongiae TaxID=3098150 RepID=UPI002AB421F3|nr:DUF3667 domain-containing protein [Aquimarina sp. 2201CG5-10]MDY8136560.1 DUF3667 domain-containing protein [Aquimarina sp. 2201CG5-10]